MLIFAIDDEPIALTVLHKAIAEAVPEASVMDFPLGADALEAIRARGLRPDVMFSDIRMPGLDGLALATQVRAASPATRLVFVTAYSEYALEAFRVHANGYILKPMNAMRVQEEVREAEKQAGIQAEAEPEKLGIRCFGNFDVFWKGKPLLFARRQTKELLAYLIDRKGASCTTEEIAAALWEDYTNEKNTKAQLRILISDLRHTLANIGMEDLVIRSRGQIAVMTDRLDCDYYRMLNGDMDAVNAYRGEYMVQYSWAELTAGQLAWERGRY